jgi:preprotein translocase subunit SecA
MMTRLRLPEDEPIQNGLISRTIESAQNKIEGFNFDIRKHVLEYDDVMNKQREVVYRRRRSILGSSDMKNETLRLLGEELEKVLSAHAVSEKGEWDTEAILADMKNIFPIDEKKIYARLEAIIRDASKEQPGKISAAIGEFLGEAKVAYGKKESEMGKDAWEYIQKTLFLRTLDGLWMNHLDEIDYLRQGIGLRGYGQRDPLVEYKREAFSMFVILLESIRTTYLSTIFKMVAVPNVPTEVLPQNAEYRGAEDPASFASPEKEKSLVQKPISAGPKVGRNDPCPCGSGKKYKKCHGK